MAWSDALLQQGYVPAGVKPKTVQPDGTAVWQSENPLARILEASTRMAQQRQERDERLRKKQKEQFDQYQVLREAGYDPKAAHEAVLKGTFPAEPGGATTDERKTEAEIGKINAETENVPLVGGRLRERILTKLANDETLTAGEQKVYDETIARSTEAGGLEGLLGGSYSQLKTRILEKVANGDELSAGEQKIYQDVIAKTSSGLEGIVGTGGAVGGDRVPVVAPDGRKGFVPKAKLAAALKAGYKRR